MNQIQELLDRNNLPPNGVYLLELIPLIEMIWADGKAQDKEVTFLQDFTVKHLANLSKDADGMEVVLDELNARGMMILDSVTSPKSVIPKLARERGMPSDARDVFLDNIRDVALIHQQLDELERIARAVGSAVAVGHPYSETAIAFREWLPGARERGIDLVPISRLATPSLDHPMVAANHLRRTGTDLR